jgi:2',5'-phosphodiesterase
MPARRSSTKPGTQQHRVVSYNVLCSHLAAPDHFQFCKPEYLDRNYRMKLIQEKLLVEMKKDSIIALQEIGQEWAEELHTFFSKHNYYFIVRHYGSKFNDYMGVGLAVPLNTYDIEQIKNKRVADTCWFKPEPKNKMNWLFAFIINWFNYFIMIFTNLILRLTILLKLTNEPYNAFTHALQRWNILMCMKLRHKITNEIFWVCTYHMPCAFKNPDMMTIHASLALQYIQRITKTSKLLSSSYANSNSGDSDTENENNAEPYILLGDFNFKPLDGQYQLYINGDLDKDHIAYPKNIPKNFKTGNGDYKVNVIPVRSVYKEYNGTEPEYTNNAIVSFMGGKPQPHFKETLDYIFISSQWKNITSIQALDYLPSKTEQDIPFPSENEPSDHVLIAANLTL